MKNQSQGELDQVGDIGGGWWNGLYLDYFLLLTFGGIPWQVGRIIIMIRMIRMIKMNPKSYDDRDGLVMMIMVVWL